MGKRALAIALSLLLTFPSPALAADIEFEWIHQFGSLGPATDRAWAAAADATGTYVGGSTSGAFPGETHTGADDAFVRKYDNAGDLVWTTQFGSTSLDEVRGLAAYDGAVYLIGPSTGALPGGTHGGFTDSYVARLASADGAIDWIRQFGSSTFEQGFGVAADASGIYVGGRTSTFPRTFAWVRKYEHDGDLAWVREFESGELGGMSVATHDGAVYFAGSAKLSLFGQPTFGQEDAFVMRLDPATGAIAWTRQFGTSAIERARGLAADADGVYIVGEHALAPGNSDGFVRSYDRDGNFRWEQIVADGTITSFWGVAVDATGLYAIGHTSAPLGGPVNGTQDVFARKYALTGGAPEWTVQLGAASYDIAGGIAVEGNGVVLAGWVNAGALPGQTSDGAEDAFVARYDASGVQAWVRQFGGFTSGYVIANAVAEGGSAYVAGTVAGRFPGQTDHGGYQDAFVRKYDDAGSVLWTTQFGTERRDEAFGAYADADSVYVVGTSTASYPERGIETFVARFGAADGAAVWERRFTTATFYSFGGATAVAGAGDRLYVVGTSLDALPGQANNGGFVRAYDTAGNELWTRQINGAYAYGVAADASGVYMTGQTYVDLSSGYGSYASDGFVRKYDPSGTEVWTRQFGSSEYSEEIMYGVAADDGGVVAVGLSSTYYYSTSVAFVQRLDRDGLPLWSRQLGDPNGRNRARAVTADGRGAYVAGEFCDDPYSGVCDAFIVRLDPSGSEVRSVVLGTGGYATASGLSHGPSGTFVAGWIQPNTLTLPGALGEGSAFMLKLAAGPPTPEEVIGMVEALEAGGTLNHGQANALTSSLDAAIASVANGNTHTAVNQLEAFLAKLEAWVKTGVLDAAEAAPLIEAAEGIVAELEAAP